MGADMRVYFGFELTDRNEANSKHLMMTISVKTCSATVM
jgi:hypothetical protein